MTEKSTHEELLQKVRELEKEAVERRRFANALMETKKRYELTTSAGQVGVWDWNIETNEIFMDTILKAMLGYADNEIRNHMDDWGRLVYPDDMEQVIVDATAHLEGLAPQYECTHRMLHKDGTIRWFLARGAVIRDEAGRPYRMVGTDTNITELRQAEEALRKARDDLERRVEERTAELVKANEQLKREIKEREWAEEILRESEEKYRQLLKHAPTGIVEYDIVNNKIISVNDVLTEYSGYTREELLAMNPFDILAEDSKKEILRRAKEVLSKEGVSDTVESKAMGKNGREFWVLFKSRIVYEKGRPVRATIVIHDITELRLAEEARRVSEERYRQTVENSPNPIFSVDRDGIIQMWNSSCENVFQYGTDIIGQRYQELLQSPEQNATIGTMLAQVFKGHSLSDINISYKCKDGTDRLTVSRLYPLFDYEKRVQGCVFANTDVTERVRAEKALWETEQKDKTILENIEDGYYEVDLAGNFTFCNDSMCRILGYPKDELIGMNYREYMDQENAKKAYETFNKVYNTETPDKGFDWEFMRKDGAKRHVESSASLMKDAEGHRIGFRGILRDITEQKRAADALNKEKEKFRILIEESPLGVSLIDRDGLYKYVNPKFIEIFGYTPEDVPTGREWFKKAYPDQEYRKEVTSTWITDQKELKVGEARPRTFTVRCKGGSQKMIHFRPVTMETGDQLVFYEDITEQKRLEAQLQQAQKMEAIGRLAGGIAHEFNNILWLITGNTELAAAEIPEGNPARYSLERVEKACLRAKDLVMQILRFSRQTKQERIPVKISSIARESLKLLRPSIPATIEIRKNISTKSDTILADPTQIHQVFMNLCTNAAHAMREKGGVLEVGLEHVELDEDGAALHRDLTPGKYVRLTVCDTGHGMGPEVMERIFDPFFTTKGIGEGTGMGLSAVHGIVKSHGGTLTVQSEPGKGTTFHVLLPSIEREVKPEPETFEPVPTGNERILFVDDDEKMVEMAKRMLERLGYAVVTRTNSVEALEVFRAQPDDFDLVITDMTMPHMTGEMLARELMAIRPNIPIILCTGFNEMISEEKAKAIGIREFAMKPLRIRDLAKSIQKVLDEK